MTSSKTKAERKAILAEARKHLAEAQKQEMLAVPRDVCARLTYDGLGSLCVRIALLPSFEPARLHELRWDGDELVAYRAQGTEPGRRTVMGHERLALSPPVLHERLERLPEVPVFLGPQRTNYVVLDGETVLVELHVDFGADCRLTWIRGEPPAGLSAFATEIESLWDVLDAAPPQDL